MQFQHIKTVVPPPHHFKYAERDNTVPVGLHLVIEGAGKDAPLTESSCNDNCLLQTVEDVAQQYQPTEAGTNWKSLEDGTDKGEVSVDRVDHTPTGDCESSQLRERVSE